MSEIFFIHPEVVNELYEGLFEKISFESPSIFNPVVPTNRSPVGLEHNILFNATERYTEEIGNQTIDLPKLFDGGFNSTSSTPQITEENPLTITIKDLPNIHTQGAAYVGWTSRYWTPKRFKIIGRNMFEGDEQVLIADYSSQDYTAPDFLMKVPSGAYTELQFIFLEGSSSDPSKRIQLSELYFIHPEAAKIPYEGLYVQASEQYWKKQNNHLVSDGMKVGIGTQNLDCTDCEQFQLFVKKGIRTERVKVDVASENDWADKVFNKEYPLISLDSLEQYIEQNRHLPEIPKAEEVVQEGLDLGQMDAKLLQKVEELTLYLIEQSKEVQKLRETVKTLQEESHQLQQEVIELKKEKTN
ncbi:hypothetical protein AAG747_21215 [Rapidithrix thailandica]|uniref:Uncharacterized protein n=1 Tax=Rapidithrix thailandica TaxID=413964 RepID=A0AAW9SDB6_9BACT